MYLLVGLAIHLDLLLYTHTFNGYLSGLLMRYCIARTSQKYIVEKYLHIIFIYLGICNCLWLYQSWTYASDPKFIKNCNGFLIPKLFKIQHRVYRSRDKFLKVRPMKEFILWIGESWWLFSRVKSQTVDKFAHFYVYLILPKSVPHDHATFQKFWK